jgi:hypothetical protein
MEPRAAASNRVLVVRQLVVAPQSPARPEDPLFDSTGRSNAFIEFTRMMRRDIASALDTRQNGRVDMRNLTFEPLRPRDVNETGYVTAAAADFKVVWFDDHVRYVASLVAVRGRQPAWRRSTLLRVSQPAAADRQECGGARQLRGRTGCHPGALHAERYQGPLRVRHLDEVWGAAAGRGRAVRGGGGVR